ncbi:MAG: cell division protein FtsQ/DivIB [Pseudomonadota bacterium]
MRALRPNPPPARQAGPMGPGLSKAHFRWQRDWGARVQKFARVYLPLIVLALIGWQVAENDDLRSLVDAEVDKIVREVMADPDLSVRDVVIEGADPELEALLAGMIGPVIGMSSMELGVRNLRFSLEELGEVRKARVTLSPTGVLKIAVEERRPVALWRDQAGRLSVIDREGVEIRPARERASAPDLVLLLGTGATDHVDEALEIIAAAPQVTDRLRAMVRVGERRWDLVLDRDLRILLPAEEPAAAMARVMGLHQGESELLDRDLTVVDMRIPERPALRMTPRAVETRTREQAKERVEGEDT